MLQESLAQSGLLDCTSELLKPVFLDHNRFLQDVSNVIMVAIAKYATKGLALIQEVAPPRETRQRLKHVLARFRQLVQ